MSEPEPRRSVRATKGQHTKVFDEQPIEAPKKRGRKKKQQEEEPEEEIIRCVCGATEQDGDSEEPWIACDKCGAWQHNVCMGMSVFTEDLPKHYYCERCAPDDHKELLEALEKGGKPWESRRERYEEEQNEKKKKKKKGGRGSKRMSDSVDNASQAASSKAGESPGPESAKPKGKKDAGRGTPSASGKRKAQEDVQDDHKGPTQKARKVSESESKLVEYTAPDDLPAKISDIPDTSSQGTAGLIMKSLQTGLGSATKNGLVVLPKGFQIHASSEQWAIQIERAVRDSHPDMKQYAAQCRTLAANLKSNPELSAGLQKGTLSPAVLAVMTTDQLATKEQQQKNAEMRAKSEKQSILVTEDGGPRVRRTHKGEEVVESESFDQQEESRPAFRRLSTREQQDVKSDDIAQPESTVELPAQAQTQPPLHINTQRAQQSPKHPDFDINKVFSSVKSPASQERRASFQVGQTNGPGVDPDVDRLLQGDNESPPYSPTDDSDPDVIWRGQLVMNTIADFSATAKFAGGANVAATAGLPWSSLIPGRLAVAGRIDDQKAIEYLCGLRYSDNTDVIVVSISPSSEISRPEFQKLLDYFTSKKKYAVIGDKGVGNVRDTYLVPVPAGEGGLPEFLLNFSDNLVPQQRTEPILLAVFVYRNPPRPEQPGVASSQSPAASTPTPASGGYGQRKQSAAGPAFSPTVPQGPFQQQPNQPPSTPNGHPTQGAHQVVPPNQPPQGYAPPRPNPMPDVEQQKRRQEGEALAKEVLGAFIECPTVQFLLPQAYQMTRREWEVVRGVYERDARARDDLKHLSQLLQAAGNAAAQGNAGPTGGATQQAAAPSA